MEQSIALYENLTVIFGIAAIVLLIVSIVLYFTFDMKSVISKRLGLTERQALKRMQADAEAAEKATKKQAYRVRQIVSGIASTRDIAKKKHHDAAAEKKPDNNLAALEAEQENERLMQEAMAATASKNASYAGAFLDAETTQLSGDSETTQLSADTETMQLSADSETTQLSADTETTQLHADSETSRLYASDDMEWEESKDTVVLHEEAMTGVLSSNAAVPNKQFMLVRHIMLIHTDEVIA